ncbi:MAG: putative holin-like toxin [Lachnospiraceae bacterium]|nr:putative holin-like toxin [Lachnospiraceae bacterium]
MDCDILLYRSNRVTRWIASLTYKRREVVHMSTYETLSLMIAFGTLIIALLAYIDRKNKRK